MQARTIRFDLGIWLVAAIAAMVVGLAVWQGRPASPVPATQPRLVPTAAPLASPQRAAATAPAIVTPLPTPDRPSVSAPGSAGAQKGPAVINPGNPTSAEDPPAPQQAGGDVPPRRKGDLGN